MSLESYCNECCGVMRYSEKVVLKRELLNKTLNGQVLNVIIHVLRSGD